MAAQAAFERLRHARYLLHRALDRQLASMVGRRVRAHRNELAIADQSALRHLQPAASIIGMVLIVTDGKKIAEDAWGAPSWKEATREYHNARGGRAVIVDTQPEHLKLLRSLLSETVSLERACGELSRAARERYNEAPKATYDAVVYELRTSGLPQLSNSSCQRRLADLSIAQIKNLMASLQQWREQYPNVSDELLAALAEIYDARIVANEQ